MAVALTRSLLPVLAIAALAPAVGNIVRDIRLNLWGALIAEGVRLLVVLACIYILQRARQTVTVSKSDLGQIAIYALLVTSCFADLAPLLSRR